MSLGGPFVHDGVERFASGTATAENPRGTLMAIAAPWLLIGCGRTKPARIFILTGRGWQPYCVGTGFHALASRCASEICSAVSLSAILSRISTTVTRSPPVRCDTALSYNKYA
jgi:hypothetical protein